MLLKHGIKPIPWCLISTQVSFIDDVQRYSNILMPHLYSSSFYGWPSKIFNDPIVLYCIEIRILWWRISPPSILNYWNLHLTFFVIWKYFIISCNIIAFSLQSIVVTLKITHNFTHPPDIYSSAQKTIRIKTHTQTVKLKSGIKFTVMQ